MDSAGVGTMFHEELKGRMMLPGLLIGKSSKPNGSQPPELNPGSESIKRLRLLLLSLVNYKVTPSIMSPVSTYTPG